MAGHEKEESCHARLQGTEGLAKGASAVEIEYRLLLARDLAYLDGMIHEQLANEVTQIKRMLTSFIQKLKANG